MKPNWKRIAFIGGVVLAAAAGITLLSIFVAAPAARYAKADALLDADDAAGAYEAFDRVGDYRDAPARMLQLQEEVIASRTSETMEFGGMEWLVLEERDGKALLLLKGLCAELPFHETLVDIGWEDCTLRLWLNGAFYKGFGEAERARIVETAIRNRGNAQYGVNATAETTDSIFLLSLEEAKLYLPGDAARVVLDAKGTAAWWWLRSPGQEPILAAAVGGDGAPGYAGSGVHYTGRGVRPAMWVVR